MGHGYPDELLGGTGWAAEEFRAWRAQPRHRMWQQGNRAGSSLKGEEDGDMSRAYYVRHWDCLSSYADCIVAVWGVGRLETGSRWHYCASTNHKAWSIRRPPRVSILHQSYAWRAVYNTWTECQHMKAFTLVASKLRRNLAAILLLSNTAIHSTGTPTNCSKTRKAPNQHSKSQQAQTHGVSKQIGHSSTSPSWRDANWLFRKASFSSRFACRFVEEHPRRKCAVISSTLSIRLNTLVEDLQGPNKY